MPSRNRSRVLALVLFEGALTYLCGVAALYVRYPVDATSVLTGGGGWARILVPMAVVQGAFYLFDLYDFRLIRHRFTLILRIVQAIGLASILLSVVFFVVPTLLLGRGVFLLAVLLMLASMICWRLFATWVLGHPRMVERILILGTGPKAVDLAREVVERRELGYEVIGFVGHDPALVGKSLFNPTVIGTIADLEQVVAEHRADRIVVAVDQRRGRLPIDTLLRLRLPNTVAIEESISFYEKIAGKVSIAMLRPSWLIFSENSQTLRIYKRVRRIVETALAVVGFVVSLPVMLVTALLIKLESHGPVLYVQERVGMNNRTFRIVKLRSMHVDAERGGPVWAKEADDRVTRVGRVIRTLRVDELPQFVNVIRGDMSFIGPRPERPVFVSELEQAIPYYSQRHLVKPGLTGWAQIRYPYGASVADSLEKLQYDLYYIKNQSPVLDAFILFETVRIVIFGRGAR